MWIFFLTKKMLTILVYTIVIEMGNKNMAVWTSVEHKKTLSHHNYFSCEQIPLNCCWQFRRKDVWHQPFRESLASAVLSCFLPSIFKLWPQNLLIIGKFLLHFLIKCEKFALEFCGFNTNWDYDHQACWLSICPCSL